MPTSNEKAERLEKMINIATQALRDDDEEAALLAIEEALKAAEALPKKPTD